MRIVREDSTAYPEETVVRAARNDYMNEWIGDETLDDVLASVDESAEDLWAADRMCREWGVAFDQYIVSEAKKRALIRHLLDRGHYGPFEHPQITFAVEGVSRVCMAQITRHRVGISFDIQSQRYVDFAGEDARENVVVPPSITNARAGGRNPTGESLSETLDRHDMTEEELAKARERVFDRAITQVSGAYNQLRDLGVPPEDARFVYPNAMKTNMVVSMNLRTLLHIADMRASAESQWEARDLANGLLDEAREWAPFTIDLYEERLKNRKNRLAP